MACGLRISSFINHHPDTQMPSLIQIVAEGWHSTKDEKRIPAILPKRESSDRFPVSQIPCSNDDISLLYRHALSLLYTRPTVCIDLVYAQQTAFKTWPSLLLLSSFFFSRSTLSHTEMAGPLFNKILPCGMYSD